MEQGFGQMVPQTLGATVPAVPDRLPSPVQEELVAALRSLRRGRGLLVRVADVLGLALGSAGGLATRFVSRAVGRGGSNRAGLATKLRGIGEAALARAFDVAVMGVRETAEYGPPSRVTQGMTRAAVTLSGAVGGFYGVAGMLPDAGFTTLAIMRDIARIAHEEGEDLRDEDARRACLEVFLLSPDARLGEDGTDSDLSYFSARLLLQGRPVVALLSQAGARYGVVLSDKLAVQAVPVVGAMCGAAINAAFLSHFRDLARAHFTLRRLERAYGATRVRAAAALAEAALA